MAGVVDVVEGCVVAATTVGVADELAEAEPAAPASVVDELGSGVSEGSAPALELRSCALEPPVLVLAFGSDAGAVLATAAEDAADADEASAFAAAVALPVAGAANEVESARALIASAVVSNSAVSTATHQALIVMRHPDKARRRSCFGPTEPPHS